MRFVKTAVLRTVLLLALTASFCAAQTLEVESLFQPAPLAGLWKHQMGDDPRWADPAFDDSAWQSVRMPEGAALPGLDFSWYRFRVRLPETMPQEALALMVGGFGTGQAYQVFWNGERVGAVGDPDGSRWGLLLPAPQAFDVRAGSREAVIAIRLRTGYFPYIYRLDPSHRTSLIGTRQPIDLAIGAWHAERLRSRLPELLITASLMMPVFFFLALSVWHRGSQEYFWFGLWLLGALVSRVLRVYPEGLAIRTSLSLSWLLVFAVAIPTASWVGILKALFQSPLTRKVWLTGAAGLTMFCAPVVVSAMGGNLSPLFDTIPGFTTSVCLTIFYFELGWRTSRVREEVPAIHGAVLGFLSTNFIFYSGQLLWSSETYQVQGTLVRTVSLFLFTFAMAILMNQRTARLQREGARLGREMESAAEVQSLLLTTLPDVGGDWRIEPVYLPASEVGGDFYQVLERPGGSRIVLVGDVSGKGLKAAMLVSVCVGILRNVEASSPAQILAALNRGLVGHTGGGFVTCCCARFDADGTVTLANAGHPAPYCDGREVEMEAGLPLGIAPGVEYAEFVIRGERFTFVSDGVVEADNAERELFGFERTQAISGKSAGEIAEAAKAWGQNDDITVVTVRRNG